jgi:TonB family protein
MNKVAVALIAGLVSVTGAHQDAFTPAQLKGGGVPALPVMAVGGGQVLLELGVGPDGRVVMVTPLRTTPPFTEALVGVVRNWQFRPAERLEPDAARAGAASVSKPVRSNVLVAAVFRAPTLKVPTLGEPPRDVSAPSGETAFPFAIVEPEHPPQAIEKGVVLLEVKVDAAGNIAGATVIRSAPPYDQAALDAIKRWQFRPGRVRGAAVPSVLYVLVGFPVPVT